jgi:phospholipid/cholesterol/gamma-HCH transport system substrate-binding protein
MRRLLRAPRAGAQLVWAFVNPQRTAGRVPLGRFVIALQVVAALIFVAYTLEKKSIGLPGAAEPYEIEAVFRDSQGLDQVDEPGAAVAGMPLGRVSDVRYEDGRSVATLRLDPEVRGKVFADASAAIRPGSAIQNLVVNVDPGTPAAGPLPEGEPIPAERTHPFVAIDELTSVLDADTRAYASILIAEAERGLRGGGGEVRRALGELGNLTETAAPIARALAARRRLLTRLVGDLEVTFAELGRRGGQLSTAIEAGAQTLEVTAGREAELAALVRELGPTLAEATDSLAAVRSLSATLEPALARLEPAMGPLRRSLAAGRQLLGRAGSLTATFESLLDNGTRPVALMVEGTEGLESRLSEQVTEARDLAALVRRMDRYKHGLPQLADTLSGAFSVNDRGGTYGQVDVLPLAPPRPEGLGLGPAAARERDGRPSVMAVKLGRALERVCREQGGYACVLRAGVPGLELGGSPAEDGG